MKYALAIDIGASSGRHIVGWSEDGKIQTKEVYRFPNGVTEKDGHREAAGCICCLPALQAHPGSSVPCQASDSWFRSWDYCLVYPRY